MAMSFGRVSRVITLRVIRVISVIRVIRVISVECELQLTRNRQHLK